MKKFWLLFIVPLFFAACSDSKDKFDPEQEALDDVYVFKSIEFYLGEGSEKKVWNEEKISDIVSNYSTTEVTHSLSISEVLSNFSRFSDYSYTPYTLQEDENISFYLPDIQNGKIMQSDRKGVFYLNGTERFSIPNQTQPTVFTVPPHSEYSVVYHYGHQQIKTNYKAVFIGEKTGMEIEITGQWEGYFKEYKGVDILKTSLSEE